jgi:hypothetical protein
MISASALTDDSAIGGGNYRHGDRATTARESTLTGHSAGSTTSVLISAQRLHATAVTTRLAGRARRQRGSQFRNRLHRTEPHLAAEIVDVVGVGQRP